MSKHKVIPYSAHKTGERIDCVAFKYKLVNRRVIVATAEDGSVIIETKNLSESDVVVNRVSYSKEAIECILHGYFIGVKRWEEKQKGRAG